VFGTLCSDSQTQTNVSGGGDQRETREGWPLLTVETEANGDLWSKIQRSPSLVDSLGSLYLYWRFLSCLGCSGQPMQYKIFFSSPFTLNMCLRCGDIPLGAFSISHPGSVKCKVTLNNIH
jgi:hypothetical protein